MGDMQQVHVGAFCGVGDLADRIPFCQPLVHAFAEAEYIDNRESECHSKENPMRIFTGDKA